MSTLGQRLKALRLEKHMTQADIGKYLNVSNVSVSGYENDTREPDSSGLKKLASLFDVSTDYLLGRTDKRSESNDSNNEVDITDPTAILRYNNQRIPPKDIELMIQIFKHMHEED